MGGVLGELAVVGEASGVVVRGGDRLGPGGLGVGREPLLLERPLLFGAEALLLRPPLFSEPPLLGLALLFGPLLFGDLRRLGEGYGGGLWLLGWGGGGLRGEPVLLEEA